MKQREAVYQSVISSLNTFNVEYHPGQDVRPLITTEIRKDIAEKLVKLFTSGEAAFKDSQSNRDKLNDPVKLKSYIAGLITNWINKDPNLNGGAKHQPKNPGSRAGGSDPMLKEMRLLKKQLQESGNEDGVAKVEAAINDRIQELKVGKTQQPKPLDIESLPDFLKDLVV